MDIKDFTPFITLFGPLAIVGAILDYAVRDEHKTRVWNSLVSVARLGQRPFSVWFYGLVVVSSLMLTLALLSISGLWEVQRGGSGLDAVKSSGPLLLAIALKIFVLDYILSLKTYVLIKDLSKGPSRPLPSAVTTALKVSIVAADLFLTGLITGMVLNWSELFQAQNLPTDTSNLAAPAKTLANFFDTLNFVISIRPEVILRA